MNSALAQVSATAPMSRMLLSPLLAGALGHQANRVDMRMIPTSLPMPGELQSLQQTILEIVDRHGYVIIENFPDSRDETVVALMLLLGSPVYEAKAGPMI